MAYRLRLEMRLYNDGGRELTDVHAKLAGYYRA